MISLTHIKNDQKAILNLLVVIHWVLLEDLEESSKVPRPFLFLDGLIGRSELGIEESATDVHGM